jgi:hypothetical protein
LSCKKRMILFDTREQKLEIWIKRWFGEKVGWRVELWIV